MQKYRLPLVDNKSSNFGDMKKHSCYNIKRQLDFCNHSHVFSLNNMIGNHQRSGCSGVVGCSDHEYWTLKMATQIAYNPLWIDLNNWHFYAFFTYSSFWGLDEIHPFCPWQILGALLGPITVTNKFKLVSYLNVGKTSLWGGSKSLAIRTCGHLGYSATCP